MAAGGAALKYSGDEVGGQRREAIGGQFDHALVITSVIVRLLE
jgi:hypothetical protein